VIFFQRKIYLFPLNYGMPTINQLIKQGRSKKKSKSKAPVLQYGLNKLKGDKKVERPSPFKR
jgi:small subunit ribosomal protein S12